MKKILKSAFLVLIITANAGVLASALSCCIRGTNSAGAFKVKTNITVVTREEGSGTRGAFIELFEIERKNSDGTRKDLITKEAIVVRQTDLVMTSVASNKYAIGYISLGSLNKNVKSVLIDSNMPSAENVLNGKYHISRPFYIAVPKLSAKNEGTKDFIEFILSSEGQAIAAKNYIPIEQNSAAYSGGGKKGKIVIAGSSSVTPVMEKLREAYIKLNPKMIVEIQQSDTSTGLNAAINGSCDIAMASRELKEAEKEKLNAIGIAIDGIVVIVNKNNPITNLNKDAVKKIFTGEFAVWEAAF